MVKSIRWNEEKGRALAEDEARGRVGFEECIAAIAAGRIVDVVAIPSLNHPSQRMFILAIRNHAYCVPFVESDAEIFLRTVFPSRKFTAIYLPEQDNDEQG
jgi:hypothetical protein